MTDILNDPIEIDNPATSIDAVRIAILIDESGSMSGCVADTIKNLNGYIDEQRTNDKTVLISVYTFNSNKDGVRCRYASANAKDAAHLWHPGERLGASSDLLYSPAGGTPLYDAMGEVITKEAGLTPTLVVILTDGAENASREFNRARIQSLITQKEEEGWTFVFLMADISRAESVAYASNLMGRNYEGATMSYSKGMERDAFRGLVSSSAVWESQARKSTIVAGKVIRTGDDAANNFFAEDVRDIKKK